MNALSRSEATEIARGETVAWIKRLSGFPPADGWTLTYYYRGPGKGVDVVAEAGASDYSATLTAAQTQSLAAGEYGWQAWVSRGADVTLERHQVDDGTLRVRDGFTDVSTDSAVDTRSRARKILDAIDNIIEGKTEIDEAEYTIGNRHLRHIPVPELVELRRTYQQRVNQEIRAARAKRGDGFLRHVRTKFTTVR